MGHNTDRRLTDWYLACPYCHLACCGLPVPRVWLWCLFRPECRPVPADVGQPRAPAVAAEPGPAVRGVQHRRPAARTHLLEDGAVMLLRVTVVRRLVYGLTSLTWCLPACCVMGQAPHSWQARLGLVSAASTTPARLIMHSHTTLPLVHKPSITQSTSFLILHPWRRGSCHHTASLTPHPLSVPRLCPHRCSCWWCRCSSWAWATCPPCWRESTPSSSGSTEPPPTSVPPSHAACRGSRQPH